MARKKSKVYTALDAVKDIKVGNVHHMYILKGAEVYFHDIVIEQMRIWAQKEGVDTEVIYADEVEKVPTNTGGGGMFSSGKLYIIKHWSIKGKKAQMVWEKFFLEGEDLYYVVSIEPSSKASFSINKIKDAVEVSCAPLKGRALRSFIKAAIRKRGKDITASALDVLLSLSGGKIGILVTELEKLTLIEEDLITEEVISKYFALQASGDIFLFWDALWRGDAGIAGEMKRVILLEGKPPTQIIATIATFIRGILEVGQLNMKGYSIKEIAEKTGKSPFYIGKLLNIFEKIGISGAIAILERLYALDKGIKSGEISQTDALDDILSYILSMRVSRL